METKEVKKEEKIELINCTICGSLVCKKREWANPKGILFWCRKCKRNFEIE